MSKVKFDHAVIYDGILYPADAEITVKEPKDKKTDSDKKVVTENDKRTSNRAKSRNKAD